MKKISIIPNETIFRRIIYLREEKVMLDLHIAELYGVETRVLKQAVNRNKDRFPNDLMFKLTKSEMELVVSQNVIPHIKYFGGSSPYAFTETGVAMLSGVLKSKNAIQTNLAIMRTFVALRKLALNHSELMAKINSLESNYDKKFKEVFTALKYLLDPPQPRRKKIGFKVNGK